MNLELLFSDKSKNAKVKAELIQIELINQSLSVKSLIQFAKDQKDNIKATCMEALEWATKQNPQLGNLEVLKFANNNLGASATRLQWESAKVLANIISNHPKKSEDILPQLLKNIQSESTVVRWSAARVIAEIFQIKTDLKEFSISQIETIRDKETNNGIKKIYESLIKQLKK